MVRLFSLLAAIAISMTLIAGLGVYWLSKSETRQTKEGAAAVVANSVALSLAAQIDLLNRTLDKMAQDPDVLAALSSQNPLLLDTVALKLEKHFPDALKIRLLLPGISQPDERYAPRMGFADLDMVRETLTKNQFPGVQGDKGVDRHLAIARRVVDNGQTAGVILASLNYDFIRKSLQVTGLESGYMELRQARLVLGASGEKDDQGQGETLKIKVPNTDWDLHYQYDGGASFGDLLVISSVIVLAMLISMLAFFMTHRMLSDLLSQDLRSVMKAFKDMMTRKLQGTYPVELTEMSAVISTLVQYKRVMDSDNESATGYNDDLNMNIVVSDDENFELDDFFYEPTDLKL
ncbi:MAG: hypothetical protein ACXW1W_08185 [Methylococcaceae bacterium]